MAAGCPTVDPGVGDSSGGNSDADRGEGASDGSPDSSVGTDGPKRVGFLSARRITFPPPAFDPVLFFVDGVFFMPNPDPPIIANRSVEQVRECVITRWIGEVAASPVDYLDPGEVGTASVGAAAVDLRIRRPESGQHYGPDYSGTPLVDLGFDAGATVVFEFPGGDDIAAFSASVNVPADLVLLSPDLTDDSFTYGDGSAINVRWEPDETSSEADDETTTQVWIYLSATNGLAGIDGFADARDGEWVTVLCAVEDGGTYTVSADIVAKLPDYELAPTFAISVMRVRTKQVEVELTEGGTGIVQIQGSVEVSGEGTRDR